MLFGDQKGKGLGKAFPGERGEKKTVWFSVGKQHEKKALVEEGRLRGERKLRLGKGSLLNERNRGRALQPKGEKGEGKKEK